MLMEEDETQEAAAIEEQAVTPEDSPKRKLEGLATRVSELEGELKTEKARSDDYYRRLQYLQADFENYRKRAEKEVGEVKRMGNERLLSDLLLVNDELELALQRAREKNESPALLEGVGMVHKRLQGLLTKEGVQRIAGIGSKLVRTFTMPPFGSRQTTRKGLSSRRCVRA